MNITASDENAIARLLRAGTADIQAFAAALPETRRAHLALFCFARAHFRPLGLLLAKECSRRALGDAGGYAGDFLASQAEGIVPAAAGAVHRRTAVTLAKGSLEASP